MKRKLPRIPRLNYEAILVWAAVIIVCLAFWYGLFKLLAIFA